MNKKDILEQINRIEVGFDVQSLTYKDIQIWPAIRAYIQLQPTIKEKKKKKSAIDYIKEPLYFIYSFFYCSIIDGHKNHNQLKKSNYLFIFDSSAKVKKGKVWINKFAEPLFSFLPREKSYFFIEYSLSQRMWVKRHSKSYLLNPFYLLFLFKSFFRSKSHREPIQNFESLNSFLKKENISLKLSESVMIKRMEKIIRFNELFLEVLEKVKPEVVFTSVYYANISLGLALAANQKGVKTVEIQHGQQGNFHPAYSNWKNYPKQKYALHPDIFWMWGKLNVERIAEWANESSIEVLNGGNPWLNYYFKSQSELKPILDEEVDLSAYRYKILVSLQFTKDFLNSFIPKIMKDESNKFFWLIRVHPGQIAYKSTIEKYLKVTGCNNYNIEYATSAPLYDLFSLVDFNITFWSTVAYEAQIFDIKNIIVHPNGKASMADYIDRQIFAYADNKSDFLSIIDNFQFQTPEFKYMEHDDVFIEKAMDTINSLIN